MLPANATLKVRRYDAHPPNNPTVRVIGIELTLLNGRSRYMEAEVDLTLEDALTPSEMRDLALGQMKAQIDDFVQAEGSKPTFLNDPQPTSAVSPTTAWEEGAEYAVGNMCTYEGALYRCQQAHTADDPNWYPPNVPALWTHVTNLNTP